MDLAQHVKSQLDIVRVISDYVPRLRRFGNRYSCLCPFHNEKTPSFSIYADHQFYKCFGCDAKGDVFNFVMNIERLTFWEALKKLAEQNGIELPKQSAATDERTKARGALREMHDIAVEHFRANLGGPNGAQTRAYLKQRGVTQQSAQLFQLGLADASGRALLRLFEQRHFKPDQMVESGLVGRREDGTLYDRFRNRLMFPIHDESGKPIAFGGRALDPEDKAKYLNSPETEIYKKSHVLYNLNRARQPAGKLDRVVLVEGYMDVIGATQAGVAEVVAPCGTALTTEQIRALKRQSQNLYLNFDPDSAGAKAAERSIKLLLDENVRVRVVELPGGLDPDEYCREHGPEAFRERIANAKYFFHWVADYARSHYDRRDPQSRHDMYEYLKEKIQLVSNTVERLSVAHDLAAQLGVELGVVLEDFRKMAADRGGRARASKADPARAAEQRLLLILLNNGEARAELIDGIRHIPGSGPLFATLIAMHDAGEAVSFHSLHERLTPPEQEQLMAILQADGAGLTLEDGADCVEALRRSAQEAEKRELKVRIKAAEREGHLREAMEMMARLAELG